MMSCVCSVPLPPSVQTTDVSGRKVGNIWHKRPIPTEQGRGVIAAFSHVRYDGNMGKTPITFTRISFSPVGDLMAAVDRKGNIYAFYFDKNRFHLVHRAGVAGSSIAFVLKRPNEILVGHADNTLKCYNISTGSILSTFKGHRSPITGISIHPTGGTALTTSTEASILWDLTSFLRKRALNGSDAGGLQHVAFLPSGDIMLTLFQDNSIFGWDVNTFNLLVKIPSDLTMPRNFIRTFGVSHNGRIVVLGDRGSRLHIWTLDEPESENISPTLQSNNTIEEINNKIRVPHRLVHVLNLPESSGAVKQIEFIPENFGVGFSNAIEIAAILSRDGALRFVNISTGRLEAELGGPTMAIDSFSLQQQRGRFLAVILEKGSIRVYDGRSFHAHRHLSKQPCLKSATTLVSEKEESNVVKKGSVSFKSGAAEVLDADLAHKNTKNTQAFADKQDKDNIEKVTVNKSTAPVRERKIEAHVDTKTAKKKNNQIAKSDQKALVLTQIKPDFHSHLQHSLLAGGDECHAFNSQRLRSILMAFGQYPSKYRPLIWSFLLRLPCNREAFDDLTERGGHPALERLHERYPLRSSKLARHFHRTLSALSHWTPLFAELPYLPGLAFPFVKVFAGNTIAAFETVASLLTGWCQGWFDFFPNPPVAVLNIVENLLGHHDRPLLKHFIERGYLASLFIWPPLSYMMSDVLNKADWLQVWDHVLSNHPGFLFFVVVAFFKYFNVALLKCESEADIKYFLEKANPLNAEKLIKLAYNIRKSTPDDINPCKLLQPFVPLAVGHYPVFNKYPQFVVDYQIKERERIRMDENDYLRQRQILIDLREQTLKMEAEGDRWQRDYDEVLRTEQQRREELHEEEQGMLKERAHIESLKKAEHLRQARLLEEQRERFMSTSSIIRKAEINRLEDEIARKSNLHDLEVYDQVENHALDQLKLQKERVRQQQKLEKEHEESMHFIRTEIDQWRRADDIEKRQIRSRRKALEEEHEKRKLFQKENALASERQSEQFRLRQQAKHALRIQELEKDYAQLELERKARLLQLEEEEQLLMEEERHQRGNILKNMENKEANDVGAAASSCLKTRRNEAVERERFISEEAGHNINNDVNLEYSYLNEESLQRKADFFKTLTHNEAKMDIKNKEEDELIEKWRLRRDEYIKLNPEKQTTMANEETAFSDKAKQAANNSRKISSNDCYSQGPDILTVRERSLSDFVPASHSVPVSRRSTSDPVPVRFDLNNTNEEEYPVPLSSQSKHVGKRDHEGTWATPAIGGVAAMLRAHDALLNERGNELEAMMSRRNQIANGYYEGDTGDSDCHSSEVDTTDKTSTNNNDYGNF